MQILEPHFVDSDIFFMKEPWLTRVHKHIQDNYQIHLFLSGDGFFRYADSMIRIEPNLCVIVDPGVIHQLGVNHTHNKSLVYYSFLLHIPPEELKYNPVFELVDFGYPYKLDPTFYIKFETLMSLGQHNNAYVNTLLINLLSDIALLKEQPVHNLQEDYVQKTLKFISKNVFKKLSLADIENNVNLSAAYISRLFKSHIGMSPMQYHLDLRLNIAKRILSESTSTIREISDSLNFNNEFHFSNSFTRKFGISPNNYRKKLLENTKSD